MESMTSPYRFSSSEINNDFDRFVPRNGLDIEKFKLDEDIKLKKREFLKQQLRNRVQRKSITERMAIRAKRPSKPKVLDTKKRSLQPAEHLITTPFRYENQSTSITPLVEGMHFVWDHEPFFLPNLAFEMPPAFSYDIQEQYAFSPNSHPPEFLHQYPNLPQINGYFGDEYQLSIPSQQMQSPSQDLFLDNPPISFFD